MVNKTSLRERFAEDRRKKELADELRNGKIKIDDLTSNEIEEMTNYFIEDTAYVNRELERIKMHIIDMQKQLKNF